MNIIAPGIPVTLYRDIQQAKTTSQSAYDLVTSRLANLDQAVLAANQAVDAANLAAAIATDAASQTDAVQAVLINHTTGIINNSNAVLALDIATAKKSDLSGALGGENIGLSYPSSSSGIVIPNFKLNSFIRSMPLDIRTCLPGNYVTDGSVDYTFYVQLALNYLRDQGGGRLLIPPNLKLKVAGIQIYTGTEIIANDWTSEFIVPANTTWGLAINGGHTNFVPPGSPDPSTNIRNVRLSGFAIRGESDTPVFAEHLHLLNFNAVSDLLVEHVRIKGAQGDGIYLGSSNVNNVERHNERIVFDNLYMDGVNNQNRNAISIIDGTKVAITNFTGLRWTRGQIGTQGQPGFSNSMPGTIDLEPNAQAFSTIRDITIDGFIIDGGTGCGIAHLLPSNANITTPIQRLTIKNGVIRNKVTGFVQGTNVAPGIAPHDLKIDNVTIEDCERSFSLDSTRGAEINNLRAYRCNKAAQLGAVFGVFDIKINGLRMFNCGRTETNAMWIRTVDGLQIHDAAFIDSGRTDVASGRAIWFSDGSGKNITIANSSITSPTGKTTYPIGVSPLYTLDNSTCRWSSNTVMTGGNDFVVPGRTGVSSAPVLGTWAVGQEVFASATVLAASGIKGWTVITAGVDAAVKWETNYFHPFRRLIQRNYQVTENFDAGLYDIFSLNIQSTPALTYNAPTNGTIGQELTIRVKNISGGVMGAITWNAVFKMSGWTNPATGKSRSITFVFDGTNWIEISQTTGDVAN